MPQLRVMGQDVGFAAARGDERAVREGLEARWRAGELPLATVVRATLLRTRGCRDAEGYALARLWAERLARTTDVDTLAATRRVLLGDLLVAADRWGDVLRVVDGSDAAFARDSASGARHDVDRLRVYRGLLHVHRAVALIHLGRRAEALAIDSAFARTVKALWDRGRSAMARGVIAAHLAESDRALVLLTQGGLTFYGAGDVNGLATIDGSPLLLPLRRDPRFRALAGPDPADGR